MECSFHGVVQDAEFGITKTDHIGLTLNLKIPEKDQIASTGYRYLAHQDDILRLHKMMQEVKELLIQVGASYINELKGKNVEITVFQSHFFEEGDPLDVSDVSFMHCH